MLFLCTFQMPESLYWPGCSLQKYLLKSLTGEFFFNNLGTTLCPGLLMFTHGVGWDPEKDANQILYIVHLIFKTKVITICGISILFPNRFSSE